VRRRARKKTKPSFLVGDQKVKRPGIIRPGVGYVWHRLEILRTRKKRRSAVFLLDRLAEDFLESFSIYGFLFDKILGDGVK
jgi:hypothetical protein